MGEAWKRLICFVFRHDFGGHLFVQPGFGKTGEAFYICRSCGHVAAATPKGGAKP